MFETNLSYDDFYSKGVVDRLDKMAYVFDKYFSILKGKVLDAGNAGKSLRKYIKNYTSIDLERGSIILDLEKEILPLEDNSFDRILCLSTLEHLNNLHEVFDELCRVTKCWLVISLPNCRPFSFRSWLSDDWGLPIEKPQIGYRHKWYYRCRDAINFIKGRAERTQMEIIQMDWERRRLRRVNIWAVMRKLPKTEKC